MTFVSTELIDSEKPVFADRLCAFVHGTEEWSAYGGQLT